MGRATVQNGISSSMSSRLGVSAFLAGAIGDGHRSWLHPLFKDPLQRGDDHAAVVAALPVVLCVMCSRSPA
jgi:hypothetical protein